VRIGTATNLNADRGLNAADVRTHEPVDRRAQGPLGVPVSLSLSLSTFSRTNATAGILITSFHPTNRAVRVSAR